MGLTLFNQFELTGAKTAFRFDKVRALLAYLVVEHSKTHHRTTLATLLWSELPEKHARNNLRLALHNLRQILREVSPDIELLQTTRSTIRFEPMLSADTRQFEQLLTDSSERAQLEQAAALYTGDFCRGLYLTDAVLFEEWLLLQQERFHQQAVTALGKLLTLTRDAQDWAALKRFGERLNVLEPLHEAATAARIEALGRLGEGNQAKQVYAAYCEKLNGTFGESPSEALQALMAQLEGGEPTVAIIDHLPADLTPFFGRKSELSQLSRWLTDDRFRLITLVGMGGIGKTRLALAAARCVQSDFPAGAYFVPLAGLEADSHHDQIAAAIAAAVGCQIEGNKPPADQLCSWLQGRKLLLVLDNWEQIVESADILPTLLKASAELILLCTSQVTLDFQAERVFEVTGLPVPALDAHDAGDYSSVALLRERAERFVALDDADALSAIALCDLLDGHPLAIELAAAALRDELLTDLLAGLQRSVTELAVTFRDLPPRQRSIHAMFDRTWQLLDADERTIMRALSVMRGQFSTTAATAIAGVDEETLYALYDKSLLQRVSAEHFSLHSLTTHYIRAKLQQHSAQWQAALANHHTHYLTWVADAHQAIIREGGTSVVRQLNAEYDNIRFAWTSSMKAGNSALIAQSSLGLSELLAADTRLHEGAHLFGLPLNAAQTQSRQTLIATSWLQGMRAYFQFQLGKMNNAEQLFETAVEIAEEMNEPQLLLQMLHHANDFQLTHTDGKNLTEQLIRTEQLARKLNNVSILGLTTQYRGGIYSRACRYEEALPFFQEAEQIAQANQLTTLLLESYAWQAHALRQLQRWPEFLRVNEAGIALAERKGEKLFKATLIQSMAGYYRRHHEPQKAIAAYDDCLKIAEQLNHAKLILTTLMRRATLLEQIGRYNAAIADYQTIYTLYGHQDDSRMSWALAEIGRIQRDTNPTAARQTFRQLLDHAHKFDQAEYITLAESELQSLED